MFKLLVAYTAFSVFTGVVSAFMADDWSWRPFAYAFAMVGGLAITVALVAWGLGAP